MNTPSTTDSSQSVSLFLTPVNPDGTTAENQSGSPLYTVAGPLANKLIDLQLHKIDVQFVAECLQLLTHKYVSASAESEAIWTAAMVRFFKCFAGTEGGRSQLSPEKVFKSEPAEAMVSFKNLQLLRNKNLVHDQNSFMQGKLGISVEVQADGKTKVGALACFCFNATTLDDENVSNLTLLTQCAINWIDSDYSHKQKLLHDKLSALSIEELVANGVVTWTTPSYETIGETKK